MGKVVKAKRPNKAQEDKTSPSEKTQGENSGRARRKPSGQVQVDEDRCKGCGFCVAFCPRHVLELSERFNSMGYHPPEVKKPEECIGCGLCGFYCPDFAIFGVRIPDDKKKKDKNKT